MELTLTITGTQGEAGVIADVIRGLQGKVTDMVLGVSKVEKVVHAKAGAPVDPANTLTQAPVEASEGEGYDLVLDRSTLDRTTPAAEGAKRRGRPPKVTAALPVEQVAMPLPEPDDDDWLTLQDFRSQAVQWLKANPHLNAHATDVFTKHVGTNSGQLQDVPQSARRQFLADLQAIAPAPNGEAPSWG
jgi:hypothetical protein